MENSTKGCRFASLNNKLKKTNTMTEGTYPNWTCPHCGGKSFTVTYLANGGGSIKCDKCGSTGGGSLTKKLKHQ